MTKKPERKKPKGFKPGSRKGQRMQRLSDAIKTAAKEGEAWITHQAPVGMEKTLYRLRIVPPDAKLLPTYGGKTVWALLRCKDGIGLFQTLYYKGERLVAYAGVDSGSCYRTISEQDFLAIVIEYHLRESND